MELTIFKSYHTKASVQRKNYPNNDIIKGDVKMFFYWKQKCYSLANLCENSWALNCGSLI